MAQELAPHGRVCWICLGDETEPEGADAGPFVKLCPCTLQAHEACLLKWMLASGKPAPACPQCGTKFAAVRQLSPLSLIVAGLRRALAGAAFIGVSGLVFRSIGSAYVRALYDPVDADRILGVLPIPGLAPVANTVAWAFNSVVIAGITFELLQHQKRGPRATVNAPVEPPLLSLAMMLVARPEPQPIGWAALSVAGLIHSAYRLTMDRIVIPRYVPAPAVEVAELPPAAGAANEPIDDDDPFASEEGYASAAFSTLFQHSKECDPMVVELILTFMEMTLDSDAEHLRQVAGQDTPNDSDASMSDAEDCGGTNEASESEAGARVSECESDSKCDESDDDGAPIESEHSHELEDRDSESCVLDHSVSEVTQDAWPNHMLSSGIDPRVHASGNNREPVDLSRPILSAYVVSAVFRVVIFDTERNSDLWLRWVTDYCTLTQSLVHEIRSSDQPLEDICNRDLWQIIFWQPIMFLISIPNEQRMAVLNRVEPDILAELAVFASKDDISRRDVSPFDIPESDLEPLDDEFLYERAYINTWISALRQRATHPEELSSVVIVANDALDNDAFDNDAFDNDAFDNDAPGTNGGEDAVVLVPDDRGELDAQLANARVHADTSFMAQWEHSIPIIGFPFCIMAVSRAAHALWPSAPVSTLSRNLIAGGLVIVASDVLRIVFARIQHRDRHQWHVTKFDDLDEATRALIERQEELQM